MRLPVLIVLATLLCGSSVSAAEPTFTRDLAPLVYQHCAPCHQPGGSAPFSLLSYEDLRPRAREVVNAVVRRQMPPWRADGPRGLFTGDRRLADVDLDVFRRWLEAGAPRGNPDDLPAPPQGHSEWELGPPDLVVHLDRPYDLAPDGRDQLRNFVVSLPLAETRHVRAWEFRTSRPSVVHHATLMVDRGGGARRFDAETSESGYEGLIPFTAQSPDGYFLGWTPGQRAQVSDADMAWRVDPGNDLIVMLHMKPGDRPERVDASVALYFSDRPPSRTPVMIRLNRQDLDIPAGAAAYTATDSYVLPVDVDLYAIQPHAHYLATTIQVQAESAGRERQALLSIGAWDFHWQDVYRYAQPLHLPAQTRLSMAFTFDNSAANRSNPNRPPARVIWGQRSRDEMADVWLQVVPRRESDRERLVRDLRRAVVPSNIDGYRKMLEVEPANPALHDDLALLAIESGNVSLAVQQFGAVVGLRPSSPAAHYNLGNALLAAGRHTDSLPEFREAVRLDGSHGLAHQGLGLALAALGRLDDAAAALADAARLLPDSVDVAYNIGVVQQRRGRDTDALEAYERALSLDPRQSDARYGAALIRESRGQYAEALRLLREVVDQRPGWTPAQLELAWLRATAPDAALRNAAEAVALARDGAGRSDRRDVRALDVLAAAYAAAGRFDDAVLGARAALEALGPAGDPLRVDALRARLRLYESKQPYLLPQQ
ncbi:MAG: tetratricopeptide repeat protein [Vicinamibacterales bacterium]